MKTRKCPECNDRMFRKTYNWVTIDKCPSCHWVFLDFMEIKDIIDNIKIKDNFTKIQKWDFKRDNLWKDIICANCKEVMDEREYIYWSWNHINFCTSCWSIYLDEWELKQVQDFEISRIHSKEWRELIKEVELKWLKNPLSNNTYSIPWVLYWILNIIFK